MTQPAIPAKAADWARGHVGRHAAWALPADLSGTRAWRMSSPQGLIDIRVTRTDEDFGREVYAHRNAIRCLGPSHGPRLLASEPRLRSLLTLQPRGWRVDTADLQFQPRVHEDAGRLLRILHDSVSQVPEANSRATRATVLYAQRIQTVADHLATVAPPEQAFAVHRSASLVLRYVRDLRPAFCHGTFGPASWTWQNQSQTLSFTEFGRSEVMAAVIDLARPARAWAEQPKLRDWFLKGYGRPLSWQESLVLRHWSVLAAGEDLHYAIHQRNKEGIPPAASALRRAIDHTGFTLDEDSLTPIDAVERGWQ
ncbi:hypothetical protein [Streptomyces sp. S.PNR 29]|uniref:hypothetical protein n=1 Tax=Streptomyces sp. S.PNR 29 TaxID=2973805 RepID=UPI0025B1DF7B|nr:hypothetical protein [Streptomyces sp. S.PNR 29]MDN0193856.1 hypothetical protein [Streptomyces sp. S.PNR 29]